MKVGNKFSILLIIVCFISACQAQQTHNIDVLVGTWKMENKETYEVWEKEKDSLKGHAFSLREGQKQITETLEIEISDHDIIYKATVPNQNEGQTIPFKLNKSVQDLLSFENMTHDFPKKIQYKWINEDRIQVHVLGEDDKGFSYILIK